MLSSRKEDIESFWRWFEQNSHLCLGEEKDAALVLTQHGQLR
jgi:hypothetical protein